MTDFVGKEVEYEWDALSRREKLIYPDRSEVGYEYDASGRIKSVRSETGITSYAYNAMGLPMQRVLPDHTTTRYEFNPLGRLAGLTHEKNGEILDEFQYSYDPAGNIKRIEKQRAGLEADSGVFEYAYDPLGRLIAAAHGGDEKQYRYDELGNRVSSWHNGAETRHSYNARNQLIRTQEGESVKDYRYDGRGNLTGVTRDGRLHAQYTFDATNRMVAAVTDRGRAEYAYNGFLGRVKKLETLQDTALPDPVRELRYVLDLTLPYDNLLMTRGSQNQGYVWGYGLLEAAGDENFRYLQDHLGSPIRLLREDQDDTPLAYDEFGVPLVEVGKHSGNPFGFTGYQTDDISGLYYAQARYYEPDTARLLSPDPHWNWNNLIFGDSRNNNHVPYITAIRQSANLYAYCMNNPIMLFDPLGELVWPGEIHSAVQNDIIYGSPYGPYPIGGPLDVNAAAINAGLAPSPCGRYLTQEVKINYSQEAKDHFKKKSGRADIVDINTGEFWEVKSDYSGKGLAEARSDIYGYTMPGNTYSSWMYKEELHGEIPKKGAVLPSGTFTYEGALYKNYAVYYWSPEPGVVLYNYQEYRRELKPEEVVMILLALIWVTSSGGAPAPIPCPI